MTIRDDIRLKAAKFAKLVHADQKYGDQPYTYHLNRVVGEVVRACEIQGLPINIMVAAAWLHDTLEDTSTTFEELQTKFGMEVAGLVFAVTDEPGKNRKDRAQKTLPKIRGYGRLAVALKLCDRIANTTACVAGIGNVDLFNMYSREHFAFRETLYQKGELEYLWDRLDEIFERVQKMAQDDHKELIKLRTSLARLAQRAKLGSHIPGLEQEGPEANFTQIVQAANAHDRGWNRLAAFLMDCISPMDNK